LKIETQPLDNHQVRLTAEFDTSVLEEYKKKAARQISQRTKVPGFRPGKATYDVVKRMFGDEAIEKQAIEIMVDDIYPKVLDESGIKPSGAGSLDEIISSNPPKFSFTVPLNPEVVLGDYRSIRREYNPEPFKEEDLAIVLRNMQKKYATAEPVDRSAQLGDLIYLKVSGQLLEPINDQNPELIKDRPFQVVIGDDENDENAWPFQEFSKELIGLSAQEGKTIIYNYPENSPFEKLKEKEVQFQIEVQSIKELKLPELTDEFAKTIGEYESVDSMRSAIRDHLEKDQQAGYIENYLSEIIDLIVEQSIIKYPPNVLDDEIKESLRSLNQDLIHQKMELETYLKARKLEKSDFIENEVKPASKRRLERALVLMEIAKQEKLEVGEDELKSAVTKNISQLMGTQGFKRPKGNRKISELVNAVSYDTANRLINQLIMDRLKDIATGQLVPKSETDPISPNENKVEKKPRRSSKKEQVPGNKS
jgi:trigger factor